MKNILLSLFTPNRALPGRAMRTLIGVQALLVVVVWYVVPSVLVPTPSEVWSAWIALWTKHGFGHELIFVSLSVYAEAVLITALISVAFVWSSAMPVMRPLVVLLSKFRFNSLVGITLFFTLMTSGGHELKVALMVFAMAPTFITSLAAEIVAIPKENFDHARTLGMSEWRVFWEVVALGKLDTALEVLRNNAAIGWMMLSMVEGIVRSEGGVGALLLSQSKYFHLDSVFAIQVTILLIGLGQDYLLGALRRLVCPYADLGKERR